MNNFEKLKNDFCQLVCTGEDSPLTEENIDQMSPFLERVAKKYSDFSFTNLQKEVFSDKDFWNCSKNIIVQGATSSGKTLIAEFKMAYQIYCLNKHVLYLVPLRALTAEKQSAFMETFEGKRIYSSSSDYQEHDYDLTKNKYDIGILVYEKFFALLAQPQQLIKDCDLIVVDEMHMLKDSDRGPKLEFSIEKFRCLKQKKHIANSVLGLTTIESDMSLIRNWLGTNATKIICNSLRPVDIEERYVCYDENKDKLLTQSYLNSQKCEYDGFVADTSYSRDKKKMLLINILKQHPDEKIIVFCNSKRQSIDLINELSKPNILERSSGRHRYENFPDIDDCEMDKKQYEHFREALYDYGITYHNSTLTMLARSFIEDNFKKGDIRIIIATETLTMGVNLPADIIIFYDTNVWRADADKTVNTRDMTYQEYRNALGRAGRLGLSIDNKGIGYILSYNEQEQDKNIRRFLSTGQKDVICSGLCADNNTKQFQRVLAPYYLNLMNDTQFTDDMLCSVIEKSLPNKDKERFTTEEMLDGIIKCLKGENDTDEKTKRKKPKLIYSEDGNLDDFDSDNEVFDLSRLGKRLAPFALSMNTYWNINQLYLTRNNPEKSNKDNFVLPYYADTKFSLGGRSHIVCGSEASSNNPEHSIPDYFLDVMFNVCRRTEISDNGQHVAISKNDASKIDNAVLKWLKNHKTSLTFWDNSTWLKYLDDDACEIHPNSIQPMYRAIVLYYWICGFNVMEIREKLGLPDESDYYIYTSELQSLGELCAYQLEAISEAFKACDGRYDDWEYVSSMFYTLSTRLKYGTNNELARIANRHIRGITRSRLLKLEKKAADKGCSSVNEFLFEYKDDACCIITEKSYNKLIATLKEVSQYEIDKTIAQITKDAKVNSRFMNKYEHFSKLDKSSASALDFMLRTMQIHVEPYDAEEAHLDLTGISIFVCTDRNYTHSEQLIGEMESRYNIAYKCAVEKNKVLIVHDCRLDDEETAYNCISCKDFTLTMMRIINICDNIKESGKMFENVLNNYIEIGSDALKPDAVLHLVKKSKQSDVMVTQQPADIGNQIIHIDTYVAVQQNNTSLNLQNNNQYNNFDIKVYNNILNNFINYLDENKIDPNAYQEKEREIHEEAFLKKANEKISVPDEHISASIEDFCRSNIHDYDDMFGSGCSGEIIKSTVHQAEHLYKIISDANEEKTNTFDDYSPVGILYGKALEVFLYNMLFETFKRKYGEYKLNNKTGKEKLLRESKETDITIGSYPHIIEKYLNDDANWKSMKTTIKKTGFVRNSCAHKGNFELNKLNELKNGLFKIIKNLPDLAKDLNQAK